jgi:uncharacterized membrane protein
MNAYVSKGYRYASLCICLLTLIIHLIVYPNLPDTIPYHWNFQGVVDKTGPRYLILLWPLLPIVLYFLMLYAPKIDPKEEAYQKHKKAYSVFVFVFVAFLDGVCITILLASMGYPVSIPVSIGALLGIMSLILGNYMRQIRPNHSFGIRTRWTLASEQNWRKTHRLGSLLFSLAGIWLLLGIVFPSSWWVITGVCLLVLSAIVLTLYSYVLYQKEDKQ